MTFPTSTSNFQMLEGIQEDSFKRKGIIVLVHIDKFNPIFLGTMNIDPH